MQLFNFFFNLVCLCHNFNKVGNFYINLILTHTAVLKLVSTSLVFFRPQNLWMSLLWVYGPEAGLVDAPEDWPRGKRVGLLQQLQNLPNAIWKWRTAKGRRRSLMLKSQDLNTDKSEPPAVPMFNSIIAQSNILSIGMDHFDWNYLETLIFHG
jgi:hypothetical protein